MVETLINHDIERVDLWQRGVDTEMFQPHLVCRKMRSRLSQGNPDAPLLLYVGRVSAEKQIDEIRPVLEAIPSARLAIVGDGPHREAMETHFSSIEDGFNPEILLKALKI
jgi:glycosyltransferase involved in cell wall biosynthesis